MFGFTFIENFRLPYTATSIQDFWRKWHISLSSWFKEYVYIPLGGNRRGSGADVCQPLDGLSADRHLARGRAGRSFSGAFTMAFSTFWSAVSWENG
ncbi:MAG: MBOAT family O-acyltransferase [Clostridium fessum]